MECASIEIVPGYVDRWDERSAMAEEKTSKPPSPPDDCLEVSEEDITEEDMADIQRLLDQKQDVTRQDITARDFQSLLDRYIKE